MEVRVGGVSRSRSSFFFVCRGTLLVSVRLVEVFAVPTLCKPWLGSDDVVGG